MVISIQPGEVSTVEPASALLLDGHSADRLQASGDHPECQPITDLLVDHVANKDAIFASCGHYKREPPSATCVGWK